MTLPPDYWLLGREEYVQRCTAFCNKLLKALVARYDTKYDEVNPKTGEPFAEPNLFQMDLEKEGWEEFVDRIGYEPIMGKAKADRYAALSGLLAVQESE